MASGNDYDVAVIGAGGAGLSAAIVAAQHGAHVVLVDAASRAGGATALSGGIFYAAGTSVQRARGIEDTPDAMYHQYMTLNRHSAEASLARVLCDQAPISLEWLISLGVEFRPDDLYDSGADGIFRGHAPQGRGGAVTAALEAEAQRLGVDVALQTRVTKLSREADGSVTGIFVGDTRISTGAVVIACGGFGSSQEKLSRYYPDAARGVDWTWYLGPAEARGDGLDLGISAGAEIVGFNRGLLMATPPFGRNAESRLPPWLMHVNREGKRFVRETAHYAIVADVIKHQLGGECFGIFDEAARLACASASSQNPSWQADALTDLVREGKLLSAGSLEQLAERAGIKPEAFLTAVDTYNADVDAGCDTKYFKAPGFLLPIRTAPFYAARLRPAILALTSTGLQIDTKTQVLDRACRPIAGLFAAGETTGGVLGDIYVASGNGVANAVIFGQIAGRASASYSRALATDGRPAYMRKSKDLKRGKRI